MEQASVGTDQPKAEPVERSAEVSDAQRPDPSKSIPPAFHPGALAYHPHSLPAAYPFGYWTGQVRRKPYLGSAQSPVSTEAAALSLQLAGSAPCVRWALLWWHPARHVPSTTGGRPPDGHARAGGAASSAAGCPAGGFNCRFRELRCVCTTCAQHCRG